MRAYRDFLFFCGGNAEDAGKLKCIRAIAQTVEAV